MHLWDFLLYVHFVTDSLGFIMDIIGRNYCLFLVKQGLLIVNSLPLVTIHSSFNFIPIGWKCQHHPAKLQQIQVPSKFPYYARFHSFRGFICTFAPFVTSQRDNFHYMLCHCHLSSGVQEHLSYGGCKQLHHHLHIHILRPHIVSFCLNQKRINVEREFFVLFFAVVFLEK